MAPIPGSAAILAASAQSCGRDARAPKLYFTGALTAAMNSTKLREFRA